MTDRQEITVILRQAFIAYFDGAFLSISHKDTTETLLKCITPIKDHPQYEKIVEIISECCDRFVAESYLRLKDDLLSVTNSETESLLSIFSDEEINSISTFINSQAGKKVLRNMDLFRSVFGAGSALLFRCTLDSVNHTAYIADIYRKMKENNIIFEEGDFYE